jgi:hypothetical protein
LLAPSDATRASIVVAGLAIALVRYDTASTGIVTLFADPR